MLAVAALVAAATLVAAVAAAFLAMAGSERLALSGESSPALLAGAGFASLNAAALGLFTHRFGGLAPPVLGAAWLLAFLWPLSGAQFPAAVVATLAAGLAVWWGGGRAAARSPHAGLIACVGGCVGLGLIVAALAGASMGDAERPNAGPAPRIETPALAPVPVTDAPAPAAEPPAREPDPPAPIAPGADAPPPASPATPVDAADAAALIRDYYATLDARRFDAAWRLLSPGVREAFGGFDAWRQGYATTLGSRPIDIRIDALDDGTVRVRHRLVARDSTPCGRRVERSFAIEWKIVRSAREWRAAALSAAKLAGPEPSAVCG